MERQQQPSFCSFLTPVAPVLCLGPSLAGRTHGLLGGLGYLGRGGQRTSVLPLSLSFQLCELCAALTAFLLLTVKFNQILTRLRVRKTMGTTGVVKEKECSVCSFLCHTKSEGMLKLIILLLKVMLLEHLDHSTRLS